MYNQDEIWLLEEKYEGVVSNAFVADCARLASGEPLAYVIGWTPFLNARIYLDSKPLIPRPETEYWTEQAIMAAQHHALTQGQPPRILDLCAGSGAVGVAVAMAMPESHVTFAEIDPAHLPTITHNLNTNHEHTSLTTKEQMTVIESDLFAAVAGTFDFILTNPPYIDPALDRTEASVTLHEPHTALYGGTFGMKIIERIILAAPAYLNPAGQLWIEHEPEQVEAINRLGAQANLTSATHTDQYNQNRFSVLRMAK